MFIRLEDFLIDIIFKFIPNKVSKLEKNIIHQKIKKGNNRESAYVIRYKNNILLQWSIGNFSRQMLSLT